ncbi:Rap family tetratricopeptide repeat protein [Shouchella miscanthi]|uniref:Tetratricopeptide repeat protein n=1 Tax=Shouchella miscanthi TaxID=2598861 RepID=A0ABU6NJV3_9BACI|nr:tetratricopeptide repeat protein [Shouchella miscanthi]
MYDKIPASDVGAKIVEWYSCILLSSYEEATLLKNEVTQMLGRMEKSDKMLAYFSLVEYRHNNMLDGENKSVPLSDQFKYIETDVDRYLKYLYYFVSGQFEYNNQRYRTAIRSFRKAERLLEHVDDETETLEFYMYTGVAYYRINQYLFAASYLEEAETGFRRIDFIRKALNCKQILASISSELKEYDRAEKMLKETLAESTYPITTVTILRALGLCMFAQKKYEPAANYFKKALEIKECRESIFGMRCETELSHCLFKLGNHDEALISFRKAKAAATQHYNELEFKIRCQYLEGLFIENDLTKVEQAINELSKAELYFEMCELSEELIEIFEENGDNENVIKYLKYAYQGKLNQTTLGDGQK